MLKGKSAIVTGSTSGIGLGIAEALAAEGVHILFNGFGDQAEIDKYWDLLTKDGGQESQCGWLKDKFGVSWQVVSPEMGKYLGGSDPEGAQRATQAMLQMKKLDLAAMEKAYKGK